MRFTHSSKVFFATAILVLTDVNSFSRERLPGIWKLTTDSLPFDHHLPSKLKGTGLPVSSDVLLRLDADGNFQQCNEGYQEGRWMSGQWCVRDHTTLVFALKRQYYGPTVDVVLEGRLQDDDTTNSVTCVKGSVQTGKFMYPSTHPSFLNAPLVQKKILGDFVLEQQVSTYSLSPPETPTTMFSTSDFFNRTFVLTVTPLGARLTNQPFDLRAMRLHFHTNSTFQAWATNKILRGRYDVQKNRLMMDVSIFGAGRSAPGSIYSEGIGLSAEDERSYIGDIQEEQGRLFVDGSVMFGTDMGTDARPEPVGKFLLTEMVEDGSKRSSEQTKEASGDNSFQ